MDISAAGAQAELGLGTTNLEMAFKPRNRDIVFH